MRISNVRRATGRKFLNGALAAGVALGVLGLGASPAMAAKEPKPAKGQAAAKFSKEFAAAAQPLQVKLEAIRAAKAKVDAKDPAGRRSLPRRGRRSADAGRR